MKKIGKKAKGKKFTHRDIGLLFNIHTSNGFACKRVEDCKKKSFSIFNDVLPLEVKTLSLVCLGKLFQILTPEILSD